MRRSSLMIVVSSSVGRTCPLGIRLDVAVCRRFQHRIQGRAFTLPPTPMIPNGRWFQVEGRNILLYCCNVDCNNPLYTLLAKRRVVLIMNDRLRVRELILFFLKQVGVDEDL